MFFHLIILFLFKDNNFEKMNDAGYIQIKKNDYEKNKINIFRLDVTSSYFSYLDNLIYTEKMYDKKNYILL